MFSASYCLRDWFIKVLKQREVMALRPFLQRVGYYWTCILPADILSSEAVDCSDPSSLRKDASSDELSFCQVINSLQDGSYKARVAASPDADFISQGYTVLLSEEQLAYALPWDCRLQGRSPEYICKVLLAHRASLQPPRQKTGMIARPSYKPIPLSSSRITAATPTTISNNSARLSLPHIFVSEADCQQAIEMARPLEESPDDGHRPLRCKTCQRRWLERIMAGAALIVLEKALLSEQPGLRHLFEEMQLMIRWVKAHLCCFRRYLVHISPVCRNPRQLGWYVQVDVPRMLATAA
jgi:hypothetical protein